MAEGKVTVGVQLDAQDAFDGFADTVLAHIRPALEQIQRDMESKLGDGGGSSWSRIGDIAGGSFIGSFAANIATKGLALIESAVSKVASVIQGVLSKGWDRLVMIDTAKTKLEALGNSAEKVQLIMANALTAVKGTAFSMQDAATVAATAVAAQVAPGESLIKYLRLIADTAAVTRRAGADMGEEFNNIGFILNQITTQGYARTGEIQMLAERGLPIWDKLATVLKTDVAGAMAQASGETAIGASKIREALEMTVGGAALKMGESFEGGSANAQAAMSRLGEALLKPIFEPAKDGVFNVTKAIDELTKKVIDNGPQITQFMENAAVVIIQAGTAALHSFGDLIQGIGEVVRAVGDANGALLTFQAWMDENIRNKPEQAAEDRRLAQEAFGWGEDLYNAGKAMKEIDPAPLIAKVRELGDAISAGQQQNLDYVKSQKELAEAFKLGDAQGNALYTKQMEDYNRKVADAKAKGQSPDAIAAIPKPMTPQQLEQQGGAGTMPADVVPPGKSGADNTPWLAPGAPIPSMDEILGAGVVGGAAAADAATADLPDAVTALTDTATTDIPKATADMSDATKAAADKSSNAAADLSDVATNGLSTAASGLSDAARSLVAASDKLKVTGGIPLTGLPGLGAMPTNMHGSHPQIGVVAQIADSMKLAFASGADNHPVDNGFHPKGMAGDFSNQKAMGAPTPEMSAFASAMLQFAPYIRELIYSGIPQNIYQGKLVPAIDKPGSPYTTEQAGYHGDHVHVAIEDSMAAAFAQAVQAGVGAGVATVTNTGVDVTLPTTLAPTDQVPITATPTVDATTPAAVPAPLMPVDPAVAAAAAQYGLVPSNEIDYNKLGLPAGKYVIPGGLKPADPAKIEEQAAKIRGMETDLIIKEQRIREMKASAAQSEKLSAANEYNELKSNIAKEKEKLDKLKQGEREKDKTISISAPAKAQPFDFNSLPYGHPARIVAGMISGMGGTPEDVTALVSPLLSNFGGPIGQVAGDAAAAAFGIPLPGPMGYPGIPTAPSTDVNKLLQERNPLALAQMAGINVPDYSRAGGGPQDLMRNTGAPTDAMGRMYSDTAALIDRTFTNLDAAEKARHDQVMTVLNEVRDRLAKDYVGPVTQSAVTEGINGVGQATSAAIGTSMGQAAAPIIASAVAGASSSGGSPGAGALVDTSTLALTNTANAVLGFGSGMAAGGPVTGGTPGVDSVPALLMPNEYVLTVDDVRRLGGVAGVDRFRKALLAGRVRKYATGGGVNVDNTIGAEFFGVSQIPILSTIVNLLVAVLLKVIGVQIEARDTLNEISADFRDFRGEFKAFDAAGRMMNDTSGLLDRSGSSEQVAADERIRILKKVLEGLVNFLIEKVWVPIAKIAGNAALSVGSSALQGGLGAAFPGGSIVGGAIGGVMTSAGSAGIDLAAEFWTAIGESAFSVLQNSIGELLQSTFPGFTNALFGGRMFAKLLDPVGTALTNAIGGVTSLFGGLMGGLATVIPGTKFDDGGLAVGTGLMPKATIHPERVLSPQQTASFERLVTALSSGRTATTTIHAPFTVLGGERGGREARDRLLALMS